MRTIEIPQDQNPALAGARKAVYAVDESGHYTTAPSTGWMVEAVVTGQAAEEYERLAREALQRFRQRQASPLAYHMCARRLELSTLAAAAGLWRWQVRRHLRPGPFRGLSSATLRRYANALGITEDELRLVPGES